MGEYLPEASSNEGAAQRNENLPGLGGVYNSRNLQTYHYAGNNPLKYTDPTGEVALPVWLIFAAAAAFLLRGDSKQDFEAPQANPISILILNAQGKIISNDNITPENDYHGLAAMILKASEPAHKNIGNVLNGMNEIKAGAEIGPGKLDNSYGNTFNMKSVAGSYDVSAHVGEVLDVDANGDPTRITVNISISDTYDFDSKPWGERSFFAELSTRGGDFVSGDNTFYWQVNYTITMVKDSNGNWVEERTEPVT